MKKIAIIGECMIELSGQRFGTMIQSYGGDTLNTAIYLARVSKRENLEISYISVLGQDRLSEQMISYWQQEGINTAYVLRDAHRIPGLYLIELDEQGERTFLNWRNQSAARYLLQHSDYLLISEHLNRCDMIYLSGISLAILPKKDRDRLITQLAILVEQGKKIVFDSNYRAVLWESIDEAQQCYQALFSLAHIALVTDDDEKMLWGDENLLGIVERLQPFGIPHLVIKVGKEGVYYCSDKTLCHFPTDKVQKVVDTTSAGDAFNAGFIVGYLAGKPIRDCCKQGNQLAGIVIQHKGAIVPLDAMKHLHQQFQEGNIQ